MTSQKTCFIISPIGGENSQIRRKMDEVKEKIIDRACYEKGYVTIRGENIHRIGNLTNTLFKEMLSCNFAIADISGNNPNVMYEIAVLHSNRKPVIIISGGRSSDIPSDIRPQRVFFYSLQQTRIEEVVKEIKQCITDIESPNFIIDSPVTPFFSALQKIDLPFETPKKYDRKEVNKKIYEISKKIDNYIEKFLILKTPTKLYDASLHLFTRGNRFRSYIVMKSCEAVGGNSENALPFAAGIEFLHVSTLIHDDVMDYDRLRRGIPSVNTKYGVPLAILAGDMLIAKTIEVFASSDSWNISSRQFKQSVKSVINATTKLLEGQALDITLSLNDQMNEDSYFRIIGKKTGALFQASAEVGAIIGDGSLRHIDSLGSYAYNMAITFQLMDDIIGITADEKLLGKPLGSDIREGRKTLMIIHALKNADQKQYYLIKNTLGNNDASDEEIKKIVSLLTELGSIDYVQRMIEYYKNLSNKSLNKIPDSKAKNDLHEILEYFTDRMS